jgi:hypothetical protein
MSAFATPPFQTIPRGHRLRDFIPRLKSRGHLALFLVLTFFLFCPLWAYLSLCALSMPPESSSCFLYSFVFNMPASLPHLAIALALLASHGFIQDARRSPLYGPAIYRVLARAPPLK